MIQFMQKTVVVASVLAVTISSSPLFAGSEKKYTVKAESVIGVALTKGYKFIAKPLDIYSDCQITANHMKVKRNALGNTPVNSPVHEPSCAFTFFKAKSLAPGWKVKSVSVSTNGTNNGRWSYMHRPHDKTALLTIINAKQKFITSTDDFKLRLVNIVLTGPSNSSNWKQAFKK